MDQRDLLKKVLEAFEAAGVEYILVGSVASAAYGEPRLTLDIDVVAALFPGRLPRFLSQFPDPEYYCSREAATEAMERKGQFNIIHPASGMKVDIIVKKVDEFDRNRFTRKRSLEIFPDRPAFFASPEDVIIKKMEYFKEGGSEKHLRDIAGIIKVSGKELEIAYIERWASRKGLAEIWEAILEKTNGRE